MLPSGIWTKKCYCNNSLTATHKCYRWNSFLSELGRNKFITASFQEVKKNNWTRFLWVSQPSAGGSTKGLWALVFANHTGRVSQLQGDEQSWCPNESKLTNAVPIAMQLHISDAPLQVQRRLETASQVVIINEPAFSLICVCFQVSFTYESLSRRQ